MVDGGGKSKTGAVYHYYKCRNKICRKTCDKKTVKKNKIELYIVF